MAFSPAASEPQWHVTMAATFVPDPSGACVRVPKIVCSSGREAVLSRKNLSRSRARSNGWTIEASGDGGTDRMELIFE